jgi:putative ABC transport system permease protein
LSLVGGVLAVRVDRRAVVLGWQFGLVSSAFRLGVVGGGGVVGVVGVVLGLVASLFTIVPFGIARDEGIVPDGQLWLPPLVVAAVVALTLGSARTTFRRVARREAVR